MVAGLATAALALADERAASITQVLNVVQLVGPDGVSHRALPKEAVRAGTTIRTTATSRIELALSDGSVARVGARSVCRIDNDKIEIVEGAALIRTPLGYQSHIIRGGEVAAAISGSTAVLEYHSQIFKFVVLEGTGRLYRPNQVGDSVLVEPGQMIFGNPTTALSDPVDFDLDVFVKTCRLLVGFAPLQSAAGMAAESEKQKLLKSKKDLVDTNVVIFGGGSVVSLMEP